MSGSKKWYVYTTNDGDTFAINLDESNTEKLNTDPPDWSGSFTSNTLPRNIRPRSVVYSNADGLRRLRCVALTEADYNDAPATIADMFGSGLSGFRGRKRPEDRKPTPVAGDTGLLDGDNP